MNSSSIARQNRRKRLKQLSLASSDSTPQRSSETDDIPADCTLSSSESENKSGHVKNGNVDSQTVGNDRISIITDSKEMYPSTTGCSFINCDVSSRPLEKVFIEEERGFKAIDASQIFHSSGIELSQQTLLKTDYAIDLAYKASMLFHSLSNFCHGVLGGMSFLHVLVLFHLISQPLNEESLKHLGFLSQPVHNIFNFLCIICCISAFDRYDVGSPAQLFQHCDLKIIIILIYPVCLLLSLSTANMDEKLSLPEKNSTTWESITSNNAEQEFFYWKSLSILKCFGALFGWILISLKSDQNFFLIHLQEITEKRKISVQ